MASPSKPTVLIVGRLSGPKNDVILKILRDVAPRVVEGIPGVRFQVVGGPVASEHIQLERDHSYLHFEGHQYDLKPYYRKATVVIGAGRVALEAMSLKKPVVAIGERMYVGPLLLRNVERAKATNFGDCWEKEAFDWDQMTQDLVSLLQNPRTRNQAARVGTQLVKSEYDMKAVFPRLESLYSRVLLEKNLAQVHELPVLMYHQVLEKVPPVAKYNLHILKTDMEGQLEFLKARGFETITFQDLLIRRLPKKPIILTFDDGYENNYRHLFPLLKKHKMKAVIYILGDRKHKNNFWDIPSGETVHPLMSSSQIREMDKSGLVEFGSHSLTHAQLTKISLKAVEREVAGSKRALEDFLQKTVFSFAYPHGFLNEEIKKITAQAGYTFGIAVNSGPVRFGGDLMRIRRIHMFPKTSWFEYLKKTSGYYLRYRALTGRLPLE
jgi:peptidoglycan/xylan/chitin deacetylase (PgdA/CDA1 family)